MSPRPGAGPGDVEHGEEEAGSDPPRTPPQDSSTLHPLPHVVPAGTILWHCFPGQVPATSFNPGSGRGRFHPFRAVDGSGDPVPTLYAATDESGALAETVFRDVPVRGNRQVLAAMLRRRLLARIQPSRDLRLVDLTGPALRRLGLERRELLDTHPTAYPLTIAWARALHAHPDRFDGLWWVSRLNDTSHCCVLVGDRVRDADLELAPDQVPLPLWIGRGRDLVDEYAERADITVIEPGG